MNTDLDFIKGKLDSMILKKVVQIGYPNIAATKYFLERAEVTWFSFGTFNPFEEYENMKFVNTAEKTSMARSILSKKASLDAVFVNGVDQYLDMRILVSTWVPMLRKNGDIILTTNESDELIASITDYVDQIDVESFDIETSGNLTALTFKC